MFKRVRRGKRIKNSLKNFKLYYNNLRGINSKLHSLHEILDNYKPHLVCITETKLDTDEKVDIEGYEFTHKNNKKGQGGIIIGVRKEMEHLMTVDSGLFCLLRWNRCGTAGKVY